MLDSEKQQLDVGLEAAEYMISNPKLEEIVKGAAKLTATFYLELVEQGLTPTLAARITAGYATSVGKVT